MTDSITYERVEKYNPLRSANATTSYVVKLNGKRVGVIKQSGTGWQYHPKGRSTPGPWYQSLNGCMASLQDEDDTSRVAP